MYKGTCLRRRDCKGVTTERWDRDSTETEMETLTGHLQPVLNFRVRSIPFAVVFGHPALQDKEVAFFAELVQLGCQLRCCSAAAAVHGYSATTPLVSHLLDMWIDWTYIVHWNLSPDWAPQSL